MKTEKQLAFGWPRFVERDLKAERPRSTGGTSRKPARPSDYLSDETLKKAKQERGDT